MIAGEINDHLKAAAHELTKISATARLDAEILMAHALGMERSQMLMECHKLSVPDSFNTLVARRALSEPIAYIVGQQGFWDLNLKVTPDVLIPRPDSETIIEWAEELFKDCHPKKILDLGTGSGALLLAALSVFPDAHGVGIDKSGAAIDIAKYNGEHHQLGDRCTFIINDWNQENWAKNLSKEFDLILCNPPYIDDGAILMRDVAAYEPASALFAGKAGLDEYKILIPQFNELISKDGMILLEIGADQAHEVSKISLQHGYLTHKKQDLAGLDRVLMMKVKNRG